MPFGKDNFALAQRCGCCFCLTETNSKAVCVFGGS